MFPPEEGYQLRQNHNEAWVEVYVILVANRPNERDVSFSPLFVVRCYGTRRDGPQMPLWPQVLAEIPPSVTRVCQSVNAAGRPAFGAISCSDIVRRCIFDCRDFHMKDSVDWPDGCFLSLWKDGLSNYLNHVKAEFTRRWEDPYIRYSEDDTLSPSVENEIDELGDTIMKNEKNNGESLGSVHGADHGAGSDNTSSMETSSAGSSDLDTDSDISEILMMQGIRGVNELLGVNTEHGVNGHVDSVMDTQEESPNMCAGCNGESSNNNRHVLHANGLRVTIEFLVNRTV